MLHKVLIMASLGFVNIPQQIFISVQRIPNSTTREPLSDFVGIPNLFLSKGSSNGANTMQLIHPNNKIVPENWEGIASW